MNKVCPLTYGPVVYKLQYTPKNKSFTHVYIGSGEKYASDIEILIAKLNAGKHPDLELQSLWSKVGNKDFTVAPILLCDRENRIIKEYVVHNMLASYKRAFPHLADIDPEKFREESRSVAVELEWFKMHGLHVIASAAQFKKFLPELIGVGDPKVMKASDEDLTPRRRWVITMAQRLVRLARTRADLS